MYGKLNRKKIDAQHAAHLAADAGEPVAKTAAATIEWQIDATSIRIQPGS